MITIHDWSEQCFHRPVPGKPHYPDSVKTVHNYFRVKGLIQYEANGDTRLSKNVDIKQ